MSIKGAFKAVSIGVVDKKRDFEITKSINSIIPNGIIKEISLFVIKTYIYIFE